MADSTSEYFRVLGTQIYVPQIDDSTFSTHLIANLYAPQVIRQPPIIATLNPVCFQTLNLVTQSPLIVQHSIPVHLGDTVLQVKSKQFSAPKGLKMNEPQSMKPADDDPYRMYPVRELNGCFTMRNRMTIDSGDIGPCIWYESDGRFYAVVMKK